MFRGIALPGFLAGTILLAVASAAPAAEEGEIAPPPRGTSRIEGTARIDRRTPVVGATVSLLLEGSASPIHLTSTDERGGFRFDGLREGAYRVGLRREGLVSVVKGGIAVRPPFRAVIEVILQRGPGAGEEEAASVRDAGGRARVAGKVLVRGGGAVPEARVRLLRLDGSDDPRSALSDGGGGFEFPDLPLGSWRIEILGAGYLPAREDLEVKADLDIEATLVGQPADYLPPPLDLLPNEIPIPPPGW